MRRILLAATLLAAALYAADPAREQTLQRAIDLMESKGDMGRAMPLLEDAARSADKALAARALLYLGQGQERQGTEQARATYERIIKEFGGQTETVAVARRRLTGLGGAHSSPTLTKRLICDKCGDLYADFSPDGRLMLVTDWDTGDLAIREVSTGQIKRLMAKPSSWRDSDAYGESPVYSPDARQIAYLWDTGKDHTQLRVMANEPGGKARVLVDTPENTYYEPAAWSPDGKSILVLIEKPDSTWQLAWVSAADGSVKVLKSLEWRVRWGASQARARPNPSSRPRISPDGRYIFYGALASNPKTAKGPIDATDQHIYALAADGSSEVELVKTAGINDNPTLTPDGKHLLFTSDRSGKSDLWSIAVENGRAAGPQVRLMGETGADIRALRMMRSGAYYYANRTHSETIGIAEAGKTASPERLFGISPSGSPDGKYLAFFRRRAPAGGDHYDLVVHSLETGEEKAYSFNGIRPAPPRWFHEGKGVVVLVQNPGKTRGLYRVDLNSGEFKQILEFDDAVLRGGVFAISPDDQTIYKAGRDPKNRQIVDRIVAIDLKTGLQKQVCAFPGTGDAGINLSPDGRTLAIRRVDTQAGKTYLARVAVDGSDYREIHTATSSSGIPVQIDQFVWTKDGRGIFFGVRQDDKSKIMRISAEGGDPEATDFDVSDGGNLVNITLSPDGKRLAFSTRKQVLELWAIDNLLSVLE
ncbi:MAG: hypothetical protein ABI972_19455 [Acidobacteriota bacterium]